MKHMAANEPTPPEFVDDDDDLEVVAVAPDQPLRVGARVSVRFDPDATLLVQRAAALDGITQAEFIRRAALHAARKAVAHAT
jgi:hypothetical protein